MSVKRVYPRGRLRMKTQEKKKTQHKKIDGIQSKQQDSVDEKWEGRGKGVSREDEVEGSVEGRCMKGTNECRARVQGVEDGEVEEVFFFRAGGGIRR